MLKEAPHLGRCQFDRPKAVLGMALCKGDLLPMCCFRKQKNALKHQQEHYKTKGTPSLTSFEFAKSTGFSKSQQATTGLNGQPPA